MKGTGRLEELLAVLLRYGSWSASVAIGLGYALALMGSHGMRIVRVGIVLFILLPIVRVSLMFVVFIRERDFRFALISGMVLVIILLGILLGVPANGAWPGSFLRSL